jgi:hypothetical protein
MFRVVLRRERLTERALNLSRQLLSRNSFYFPFVASVVKVHVHATGIMNSSDLIILLLLFKKYICRKNHLESN